MARKQIVGFPFALAFYSASLHVTMPAATYAFSRLRNSPVTGPYTIARLANILWRGTDAEIAMGAVQREYPDAVFKGVFTTTNILVNEGAGPLKVTGPPVSLDNFEDGPIRREAPKATQARAGIMRLVASGGRNIENIEVA